MEQNRTLFLCDGQGNSESSVNLKSEPPSRFEHLASNASFSAADRAFAA